MSHGEAELSDGADMAEHTLQGAMAMGASKAPLVESSGWDVPTIGDLFHHVSAISVGICWNGYPQ